MKTIWIWFDMDGTLADLYGVENWLPMLRGYDETPYAIAKPLLNLALLARLIHAVQNKGYKVGVVSALSKCSNEDYDARVITAKKAWLGTHLKSVKFDAMQFVPYDFVKNDVNNGEDLLFDDEERHLTAWTGTAVHATKIIETLKALVA